MTELPCLKYQIKAKLNISMSTFPMEQSKFDVLIETIPGEQRGENELKGKPFDRRRRYVVEVMWQPWSTTDV